MNLLLPTLLLWLVLMIFLLIAGPTASHTLASAAYHSGLTPRNTRRDDLQQRFAPYMHPPGESSSEDIR